VQTHAELSSRLLFEAADFFRKLAGQDKTLQESLEDNARIFEQLGRLLLDDPTGSTNDQSHAGMAAKCMKDSSVFFRSLGEKNPPIAEQMEMNAGVYEDLADRLLADPLGVLE
jgi:hypothetical protein